MSEKNEIDLTKIVLLIAAKKRQLVKFAIIGLAIGVVIAFSIPKEYVSYVKIAPEKKQKGLSGSAGALANMMGYNAGGEDNGITEKLYPEVIKSTPFLLEFANYKITDSKTLKEYLKEDIKSPWWNSVIAAPSAAIGWVKSIGSDDEVVVPFEQSAVEQQIFCASLASRISATLDTKNDLYTISVRFQDPAIAKNLTDSVYNKLQKYVIDYKTQKIRYNLENNTLILIDAKNKFYKVDEVYALAEDKNRNLISKSAMIKVDRLKNERDLAYQIYQKVAIQVESDRIKLNEQTPIATIIEPSKLPITPAFPNKMLIMIGFMILAPIVYITTVLVKNLLF